MSGFEFATATEIVFGRGRANELAGRAARFGWRALLVTGSNTERTRPMAEALQEKGIAVSTFSVRGEPTTEVACKGVEVARAGGCDVIIGVGGGSALDAGKAIAALLGNPGDPLDYLEVVGRGRALEEPPLPYIAVPTTAGTGSEVTRNAVLESPEHGVKVSLRSVRLLPKLALVDPELTYSVPPDVTAATGLDALTQVIEPYVCCQPSPLTDAISLEGVRRGARSLWRAYTDGDDADAREDMAITSLFGGLSLANAKLGAVHGLAGPIGGASRAPHGAICARLLPVVMEVNLRALRAADANHPALARYADVARALLGRQDARAEDGPPWVLDLVQRMNIPGLGAHGVRSADLPALIDKGRRASSMKGNPIELSADDLGEILERAL